MVALAEQTASQAESVQLAQVDDWASQMEWMLVQTETASTVRLR